MRDCSTSTAWSATMPTAGAWTRPPPFAPRRTTSSPSDSRMRTASRTVVRATSKLAIKADSGGSRSPGWYSPLMMRRRRVSATSSAALGIRIWSLLMGARPASLRNSAAVHGEGVAVHERGRVRAQPHGSRSHLLGLGEPAHRRDLADRLFHLWVATDPLDRHFGAYGTGAHGVDADPLP